MFDFTCTSGISFNHLIIKELSFTMLFASSLRRAVRSSYASAVRPGRPATTRRWSSSTAPPSRTLQTSTRCSRCAWNLNLNLIWRGPGGGEGVRLTFQGRFLEYWPTGCPLYCVQFVCCTSKKIWHHIIIILTPPIGYQNRVKRVCGVHLWRNFWKIFKNEDFGLKIWDTQYKIIFLL